MKSMPTYIIEILRELYKSRDWIEVYSFHSKYKLSPIQISESLNFIRERGLAEIERQEGYRLRILPDGVRWIDANAVDLFLTPRAQERWRRLPKRPTNADDAVYLPKMSNLEVDFFAQFAIERRGGSDELLEVDTES